jgi:hypothetical protein
MHTALLCTFAVLKKCCNHPQLLASAAFADEEEIGGYLRTFVVAYELGQSFYSFMWTLLYFQIGLRPLLYLVFIRTRYG